MRGLRTPVGRAVAALIAVGALAILAERGRWFGRLRATGTAERLWIWAPVSPRDVVPRAFFAMREFELAAPPASATLEILGDAEYLTWLNGRQVGSGRYRAGHPIDAYEVGSLLRPGTNRWIVELRSPIGAGAMTGRIHDDAGTTLVQSDGQWGIYEGAWRALYYDEEPPPAPRARVLGRAPIGRWGLPPVAPLRPLWTSLVTDLDGRLGARFRKARSGGRWQRLRPSRRRRMPDPVRILFGGPSVGYLHLDLVSNSSRTGLVRFDPDDVDRAGWIPDVVVVTVPHNTFWQDVEPRRFHSVEIAGLDGLVAARIVPVDPDLLPRVGVASPLRSLFGDEVEPPRLPVVDQIWKEAVLDEPGEVDEAP